MNTADSILNQSWIANEKNYHSHELALNDSKRVVINEYKQLLINILKDSFKTEVIVSINQQANLEVSFKSLDDPKNINIRLGVTVDAFIIAVHDFERSIYQLTLETSKHIIKGKNFKLTHDKNCIEIMYNDALLLSINNKAISLYNFSGFLYLISYMEHTCIAISSMK